MKNTLKWKLGLPTVPGWYWLRESDETHIVKIRDYCGRLALGNSVLKGWSTMEKAFWAGPIPEPK